ncbi:MAG: ribonuclease D, partial [Alphaproteobacteria bacterium]|nr:ribonuclease D [Alphaproteobacteria bacterium]
MQLIYTTQELNNLCSRLTDKNFVAVDLEFVREKTYYPVLCLIQVASTDEVAIIDPLAPDMNFDAFFKLMENPNVTKVFHSCRQDVEILYNMSGKVPSPLFDTQIAAMVCGFGESVGYER